MKKVAMLLAAVLLMSLASAQSPRKERMFNRSIALRTIMRNDSLVLMGVALQLPAIPKYISSRQYKKTLRRHRINMAEANYNFQLSLKKTNIGIVRIDSAGGLLNTFNPDSVDRGGYLVIVGNDYYRPINFRIISHDGTAQSVLVNRYEVEKVYLLPGKYTIISIAGHQEIGAPSYLTVNGTRHSFKGQSCFGFIYMPRSK